jgi:hypothetical protein
VARGVEHLGQPKDSVGLHGVELPAGMGYASKMADPGTTSQKHTADGAGLGPAPREESDGAGPGRAHEAKGCREHLSSRWDQTRAHGGHASTSSMATV